MTSTDFETSFKRLIWWLFVSTRGGFMRTRIMLSLIEKPKNANQLCGELNVNYRTIDHHLKVLLENDLITVMGDGYGKTYFPGPSVEKNIEIFTDIIRKAGKVEGGN